MDTMCISFGGLSGQTELGIVFVLLVVSFENGFDVTQITQGYGIVTLSSVVGKPWNSDRCQDTNDGDYNHDFDKGKSSTK